MNTQNRSFTKLVSPYDVRDYKMVAAKGLPLPETFKLKRTAVKDQGSVASCVAHACSSIVEYHNERQLGSSTTFSTEFIYGYRPSGYYLGEGMYLREALKTLQQVGDCPEEVLEGNHKCEAAMNNVNALLGYYKEEANPHRISSYARVSSTEEIKQALYNYGPVLASMRWYLDGELVDGVYTFKDKAYSGNHCVLIYGWNERGWLVQNSWGDTWGNNGSFIVPFDFKWAETWSVADYIAIDVKKPTDNLFVKIFSKFINFVVRLFKRQ